MVRLTVFLIACLACHGPSYASQEMTGVTFTEYLSGKKKMEVSAEKVSIGPKKIGFFKTPLVQEGLMVKPEIVFFEEGKETSHITADSGKMNMGNKKVLLKGNVILNSAYGKKLRTKEMAIDPVRGLVSVRGSYTLEEGGQTVKGRGLKSNIRLENLKMK